MQIQKLTIALVIALVISFPAWSQQQPLRLWYNAPATYWEACVPLGNGRLGAMPDGGITKENIVLNDITLWSGSPQEADEPDAYKYLPDIQKLLLEGKNIEAQELMSKHFVCKGKGSGLGHGANVPYGSYEVLGNLGITYDYGTDSAQWQPAKYTRGLNLDNATAGTSFVIGNTTYTREYFTSFDDDVIVIKLTANQLRKISFQLSLNRPERFETTIQGNVLQMAGQLNNGTDGNGMKYMVRVGIKAEGGTMTTANQTLQLKNANSAIIYIAAGTDFKEARFKSGVALALEAAMRKPYEVQKANHIKKFQQLFHRATFNLDGGSKEALPTDQRLAAFYTDPGDHRLPVLYFQYGRYLLISSTRPGLLPPNLQGLWANTINTPWNGDYHLNINIQMNHWPLEVTNLPMLNEPFFTLVKGLVPNGEKTAKAYYNANGWVAHVITNVWGYTSPGEHYSWGSFNTGSAWLCQMLWNHYEFTKDTSYLRMLYPILKGSAEFYAGTLVKEPSHGWLVTAPSNSPENAFILPTAQHANVCAGPTIDNQILRHLFSATMEACTQLKTDNELKLSLEHIKAQLPPDQIGKDGRLMEWMQEYREVEPHHRHVSHLWGLYPGNEITTQTADWANAAKASLNARGDEGTGWSLAWKINLWARLHDGDHAFLLLQKLLKPVRDNKTNMVNGGGTFANLFCAHPPFQIDGNFGGTAGIAEMLLQSANGYIEFLPAVPGQWESGRFSGWCVRGGAEVSAIWKNKQLQQATITARTSNTFLIKKPANAKAIAARGSNNKSYNTNDGDLIRLNLKKGETVQLVISY